MERKIIAFGGTTRSPLVYEQKFKSEYLERHIYERLLKSEPSIVKLIENKGLEQLIKAIYIEIGRASCRERV